MNDQAKKSPMMAGLEKFGAAEANLLKLERLSSELGDLIPSGISFGSDPEYEDRCRAYTLLIAALPKIDGWRPSAEPPDLDAVGQSRLDAAEIDELSAHIAVEFWLRGARKAAP